MPSCSVVIVSYYSGTNLFMVTGSVLAQENLSELVIVDNGNTPDVVSKLQQMALSDSRIRIVSGHGNIGFAKACNIGARHATGEYLLMLAQRCVLPPGALPRLVAVLEKNPEAVVAGGAIVNPDGTAKRMPYAGGLSPKTALLRLFGQGRHPALSGAPYEVEALPGACLCLRKKDYNSLIGFDEGYFLDIADFDFCMRIRALGGRLLCVPDLHVVQLPKDNGKKGVQAREWHITKGLLRYYTKHFQRRFFPGFLLLVNAAILTRYGVVTMLAMLRAWSQPDTAFSGTIATKRLMALAPVLMYPGKGKELYGKTVLVTGATGQVGLCVIKRLINAGAAVLALTRGQPIPFEHAHLRWIQGDLADPGLNLGNYLVDMVVHCAPLAFLPGTIDLLADAEVKRVIAFSSTSIFGKALSKNSHEREVVEQLANTEKEIAQRCAARGLEWTILRPTMIYGLGLDVSVTSLAKIIKKFGFFPVYPPAFGRRQPVHADDLAIAVLQVAFTPGTVGKSYNVSGAEVLTYRQMLERIFKVCGMKPRIRSTTWLPFLLDVAGKISRKKHINGEIARRMNDDLVFFHDDARRDFGFSPRGFLTGGLKDIEGY